ncbi:MAG TPA: hypothetical protein VD885_07335 [Methylophilaceae bacterium]|nr:hypothetical protein [Methylophilaceae bacterium]
MTRIGQLRPQHSLAHGHQRGLALVVLVFLLSLAMAGVLLKMLTMGSFAAQVDAADGHALLQAKHALIGYVVGGLSGEEAHPGRFPCPENKAYIGTAREGEALGNCAGTLVGRFAWRTLGTGELKDGGGNRLWYALPATFRQTPINSDTPALSLNGAADQAIAVVISPGPPLSGQSRSLSQAPLLADYLELENGDGDNEYAMQSASAAFNDRLLAVKPDDIFPVLERRVLTDLAHYLRAYRQIWGAYPFAAPFADPSSSAFIGETGNAGGLLPVNSPATTWLPSTISVHSGNNTPTDGSGGDMTMCDDSKPPRLVCTISAAAGDIVTVQASVAGLGLGFYQPLAFGTDVLLRQGKLESPQLTHMLDAAGNGSIGLVGAASMTSPVVVEFVHAPVAVDWSALQPSLAYVLENRWHQLLYYKVAAPFLPGGDRLCGDCLSVHEAAGDVTDVHALLMTAGRRLDATDARPAPEYGSAEPAQKRSSGDPAQYFDSVSNIAGALTFDSIRRPRPTFNDQVEIIE